MFTFWIRIINCYIMYNILPCQNHGFVVLPVKPWIRQGKTLYIYLFYSPTYTLIW